MQGYSISVEGLFVYFFRISLYKIKPARDLRENNLKHVTNIASDKFQRTFRAQTPLFSTIQSIIPTKEFSNPHPRDKLVYLSLDTDKITELSAKQMVQSIHHDYQVIIQPAR